MKCAIVIPTFGHGEMVVGCINSYLDSGKFDGDIYTVSHDPECHVLTDIGKNIRFVNTNTAEMDSPDMSLYKGFLAFDKDYDIMIYAHSDSNVNYNDGVGRGKDWWVKLQESWSIVNKDKLWSIIIPMYAGYDGDVYKKGEALICPINDSHHFGLGSDRPNPYQGAKSSPAHSFLTKFYAEAVGKYGGNTGVAINSILHYEGVIKHKWSLVARNNNYTGHQNYLGEKADSFFAKNLDRYFGESYSAFHSYYGMSLDHYDEAWFGLTLNLHKEEILNAIHVGDYDSIDYIFNEGLNAIQHPDCNRCLALNQIMSNCRALRRPFEAHTTY